MSTSLYLSLSVLMFLEFAIWGAWMPVLAARLLGPLKMSGKQTGWIYATLPLACIVSPLVAGQLADQWVSAEWIIGVAHLIGAFLLFIAARKKTFWGLLVVMLLYSLCFAATLPLINSMLFSHVSEAKAQGKVFFWAPVAWALAGYFLTGWRWIFKTEEQGRDCLYLAAILSLFMAAACLIAPHTPPAQSGKMAIFEAMKMLGSNSNFLIFMILSMIAAGMMQFYFLGTAQFMQDMGISSKNVPASMAIAQVIQAVATLLILGWMTKEVGFKWTLVVGTACWLLLYIVYVVEKPRWLIIGSQSMHGFAYVLFIIAGQMYVNKISTDEIRGSMQALVFAATTGVGLFLSTHLAGITMDTFKKGDKFQWRPIFVVPCLIMLACTIGFILLFKV